MSDTKCSCSRTVTYGRTDAMKPQASKKNFFFLIFLKISNLSLILCLKNGLICNFKSVEPLARFSYASLPTYYLFVLQLRISGCQVQCTVHNRERNRPFGWTYNRKYMPIPSRTDSLVLPEAHSSDPFPTVTRVVLLY